MAEVRENLLSPEQMVMWRVKHHDETPNLNADSRKRLNRKIRQKLEAMTPAELSATQASLQSEWDSLEPEKKTKFLERIAAKAQKRADKFAAGGAQEDED